MTLTVAARDASAAALPPSEPRALQAIPGPTSVTLSWTQPSASNGATIKDYVIQYRIVGAPDWSPLADPVSKSRTRKVSGLVKGTAYEFAVAAVNSAGTGPWSAPAAAIAGSPRAPGTPKVESRDGGAFVYWTGASTANGSSVTDYLLRYRLVEDCCTWTDVADGVSTSRSTTVTGLTIGSRYVFQVAAVNVRGQGPWSGTSAPIGPYIPLSIAAVDAAAGYFHADGECPKNTTYLSYRWTNAPNGEGWGHIVQKMGPFSLDLRMLAAAPGLTIEASIRCMGANGKSVKTFATAPLVSGNALLPVPANSGTGRRIVYSLSAQQLWAIDLVPDGQPVPEGGQPTMVETVVKTHLVSGRRLGLDSKKNQLGSFRVLEKRRWGCGGGCPKWVSFHYTKGEFIGFHQIPLNKYGPYQQETELGQPRSHGCVRQSEADAQWIQTWTVIGDPVLVIP